MFQDQDETSPSIAAVSAPSVTCSMLAVQQQKKVWHMVTFCLGAVYKFSYLLTYLLTWAAAKHNKTTHN